MPGKPEGTVVIRQGRAYVKVVNHEAFGTGWIQRAHLVWWRWRGQTAPKGWVIHHKDENKLRDVMRNLQLMTKSSHSTHHNTKAKSAPTVQTKRTRTMKTYYKTKEGINHIQNMTDKAHSSPTARVAMKRAILKESRSTKGRKRRSELATAMWKDGRLTASSEEMRRRYLCTERAKRLGQNIKESQQKNVRLQSR